MFLRLFPLGLVLVLGGCSSPSYTYHYIPGKTATISGGYAIAPQSAPRSVHAAIAAGNQIAGLPYRYGGGHGRDIDTAYDCSGAVSFVLREAGLLAGSMPSRGFRNYGKSGEGKWISVYARKDHVFLVIAGVRFDTGYTRGAEGPQWTTRNRPARGSVIRHPRGL